MTADQFPQKNSICEVNLNTFDESMIKYEDWANSGSDDGGGGGWCVTAQVSLRLYALPRVLPSPNRG